MDGSHCAPLSSPIALGETFAGDVPLDANQDWSDGRYVLSNGAALGYRQVPTPAVPIRRCSRYPSAAGSAPYAGVAPPSRPFWWRPIPCRPSATYRHPCSDISEPLDDERIASTSRPRSHDQRRDARAPLPVPRRRSAPIRSLVAPSPSADHGESADLVCAQRGQLRGAAGERRDASDQLLHIPRRQAARGRRLRRRCFVPRRRRRGRPSSATFPLDRIISRSGRRAADRPGSAATVRSQPDRGRSYICSARRARSRGVSSRIPPSWRPAPRMSS